ncbi:pyridoxamine 5'-phosphate oxidase family protein [Amycolatopsis panacis]|nr:pyridoxamine 5'-phosphate oxidase family protein [Amycolatopsis panacis]
MFLSAVRVGVLGVQDPRDKRAPLLIPVWYGYVPGGEVVVQTARLSMKAGLVRAADRFSLCVQDESTPYRYVSVEGPVVAIEDPVPANQRRALAHRYLNDGTAEAYLEANSRQLTEDILLRMRPQRWRTADFSAFAAEFSS